MSGLPDLIRRRADELGWSMNKVAAEAEISPMTLSKFMNGLTEHPTLDTLIGLSRALHFPLRRLLEAHGLTIDAPSNDDARQRAATILGAVPELAHYLDPILELEPDDRDSVLAFVEDIRRRRQSRK